MANSRPLPISELRSTNFSEKLGDLAAQLLTLCFQRLGGELHVLGGRSGCASIRFDTCDILRDVLGALRGVLSASRDLLRCGALFLYGCRDRRRS